MITIEARGTVSDDGWLSIPVPRDIAPGEHEVVVVIAEEPATQQGQPLPPFPVVDLGPWPTDLSLRREDMYSDNGR